MQPTHSDETRAPRKLPVIDAEPRVDNQGYDRVFDLLDATRWSPLYGLTYEQLKNGEPSYQDLINNRL